MMAAALRWSAIVPAVLAVWWLTMLLGFGLLEVAIRFCPTEQLVSGVCMAPWYQYVEAAVIAGCAGIAAASIIAVSVLLAPSHRLIVASVVLTGGAVVAAYMGATTEMWSSLGSAMVAGVIAWYAIFSRRRSVRGHSAL